MTANPLRTLVVSLLVIGASTASAFAGPTFKGGRVTWKSVTTLRIDFSIQGTWRRDVYTGGNGQCINPLTLGVTACSGSDGLPDVGDVILENVGGTTFNAGDGTTIGSPLGALLYLVTSVDRASNLIYGSALDPAALPAIDVNVTHTYAEAGVYRGFLSGSDRMGAVESTSMHINNAGQAYRLETLVNVGAVTSASPLAAAAPIVKCAIDAACSFPIAPVDTTGKGLQFRLSRDFEAGPEGQFVQPGEPYATDASINASGVVTWNTIGATLAPGGSRTFYSTQITIESLSPAITGSIPPPLTGPAPVTDTIASKIALDFLIELVQASGEAPVFTSGPIGGVVSATAGKQVRFHVDAIDTDTGQTVTIAAYGLPAGAAVENTSRRGSARAALTWTPSLDQIGTHQVTFVVTDSSGLQRVGVTVIAVGTAPRRGGSRAEAAPAAEQPNSEETSPDAKPAP
jgi:hypothetical protein